MMYHLIWNASNHLHKTLFEVIKLKIYQFLSIILNHCLWLCYHVTSTNYVASLNLSFGFLFVKILQFIFYLIEFFILYTSIME